MQFEQRKTKLRLTSEQKQKVDQSINFSRWTWNHCLATYNDYYDKNKKSMPKKELQKQVIALKNEHKWTKDCYSQIVHQVVNKNFAQAWSRFFKGQGNRPKFKKKNKCRDSFGAAKGLLIRNRKTVYIPKIGNVKVGKINPKNKPRSWTIYRDKTGEYYLSYVVEVSEYPDPTPIDEINPNETIGLDFGLLTYIVVSDGQCIPNPKFRRMALQSIKRLHRAFSRKQFNSKNKEKARIKLARKYKKLTNKMKDFQHVISKQIINENQVIAVENLNIQSMMKDKRLVRAIQDASWYQMISFLEYKCKKYGKRFIKIDKYYPSTQTCNHCGNRNKKLDLGIRQWQCQSCNSILDRDLNAAINIRDEGIKILQQELGTEVASVHGVPIKHQKAREVERSHKDFLAPGRSFLIGTRLLPRELDFGRKVPIRQEAGRTLNDEIEGLPMRESSVVTSGAIGTAMV